MNDNDVIEYFIDKKRHAIISARANYKNLSTSGIDYKIYLDNRFTDSEFDSKKGHLNYCSIIARIYWGIETRPVCKVCGKPLRYQGFLKPYGVWCNSKCQLADRDFINWRDSHITRETRLMAAKKGKRTRLEKYGDENYRNIEKFKETIKNRTKERNNQIQEKRIKTCLEKYGVECSLLTDFAKARARSEEVKIKRAGSVKKSMLELYGGYTMSSPILSEKAKKTKLEKYGDEYWSNREKYKKTMKESTGYENSYQLPWIRERINYDRIIETKRVNGTLNSSRLEKELGKLLKELYPDIIEQYRDERYSNPDSKKKFVCDFYIPSIDLFIEYQGSQFHHGHPFNEKDKNDLKELEYLKSRSKYCHEVKGMSKCQADVIIKVWTESDPLKRQVAVKNRIKLLEIWTGEKDLTLETVTTIINEFLNRNTND